MELKKERVLYIDEDAETSFMMDTLLRLAHYDPLTVNFASDAIRLAESEPFALFIFGKRFPTDAGLYLYRKFQEIAPEAPVVFLPEDTEGLNLPMKI